MICMCKSKQVKYSKSRVSVPFSLKDNVMHFFCYTDQLKCLIEKFTCGCMSPLKTDFCCHFLFLSKKPESVFALFVVYFHLKY